MSPCPGIACPRLRAAWMALALVALTPLAGAQSCTFIAEGTTWLWHAEPPPASWADRAIPDDPQLSGWQLGCTPFSNGGCGFTPGTYWPEYSVRYLRQHVFLSGDETGLVAYLAIDNDFELHVNGVPVASLVHENCATRWDAAIAVPDGLWTPGDNVVALRIVDRGGVTNFEMTLSGTAPSGCAAGCAQLPCGEPGPGVAMLDVIDCAGRWVAMPAAASWARGCASGISYRFKASDGRVLRGWSDVAWLDVQAGGMIGAVIAEARCSHSPTCPVGTAAARVDAWPWPPTGPGPTLRARKEPGGVAITWLGAAPLGPGEHDHVLMSVDPGDRFERVNGEGETSRAWLDTEPFGRACYLVRVADSCEWEAID